MVCLVVFSYELGMFGHSVFIVIQGGQGWDFEDDEEIGPFVGGFYWGVW